MIKEGKEFAEGTSLFGNERQEKRDSKVVANPFYIAQELVSKVDSGLGELEAIDDDQEKAIEECKKNGAKYKTGVENLLDKHIPANRATDQTYMTERNACDQDYLKLTKDIERIEKNLEKQKGIHDEFKSFTLETKEALYRSRYKKRFVPLYKKHISKLAAALKMVCFQGEVDPSNLKSANKLKPKFKDFRDFCKRFVIPFGSFSNKPYLCRACDMIGFITSTTFNDARYKDKFKSLSDIFKSKDKDITKAVNTDFKSYIKARGFDPEKAADKETIESLRLPSIQLPGTFQEKSWHPCLIETAKEIGSFS